MSQTAPISRPGGCPCRHGFFVELLWKQGRFHLGKPKDDVWYMFDVLVYILSPLYVSVGFESLWNGHTQVWWVLFPDFKTLLLRDVGWSSLHYGTSPSGCVKGTCLIKWTSHKQTILFICFGIFTSILVPRWCPLSVVFQRFLRGSHSLGPRGPKMRGDFLPRFYHIKIYKNT